MSDIDSDVEYSDGILIQKDESILGYISDKFSAGSIKGSVVCMLAMCIGAGVLTLPNSMYKAGFGQFLLICLLAYLSNVYSCRLLVKVINRLTQQGRRARTFQEIAFAAGGWWMEKFTSTIIQLSLIGFNIAYAVLIGTNTVTVVNDCLSIQNIKLEGDMVILTQYRFWLWTMCIIFVIPLSLFRRLSGLRFLAIFNMIVVAQICLLVFGISFIQINDHQLEVEERQTTLVQSAGNAKQIMESLPPIFFAYTCQQVIFPIQQDLKDVSIRRMTKIISRSQLLTTGFQLMISVGGVAIFLDEIGGKTCNGNIIECNYSGTPWVFGAMQAGRIMFMLTLVSGAAFNLMPIRDMAILSIQPNEDLNKTNTFKLVMFTMVLILLPFGVATLTDKILSVVNIMGSLLNPFMMQILPSVQQLLVSPRDWYDQHKLFAIIIIILSIMLGITSFAY